MASNRLPLMAPAGWVIFGMMIASVAMWSAGWQRHPTPAEIEAGIARIEAATADLVEGCRNDR